MVRGRGITGPVALLALLALAGIAGCVRSSGPERYSSTAGATSAAVGQAASGTHLVAAGDTLYGISRRSGVPMRAIIEANGLQPPYDLNPGQRLVIPQVATYTVQAGDTVYGIAKRQGVEMSELARQNGIAAPYTISPGQVLVLPHQGGGQLASAAPAAPAPATSGGGIAATPLPPQGSQPAPQPTAPQPAAPQPTGAPQPVTPQPVTPQPVTPPVTQPAPAPAPMPAPQPTGGSPGPAVLPDPPARAGSKFIWPVDGTVVSSYGPKAGGLHNDGINIAAPKGSPVKAAENGVVAYVGAELKGFGNLVLVKHQGDYVTAYAHNDQILVKRGDVVRRGETIARVGSTGSVDTPQLHFEIRKGSRAVEPTAEMTAQTAAN